MSRSPNGAGPPDSLGVPQDELLKSNPSNGLVERLRASAQAQARDDGYPLEQHAAWEAADENEKLREALEKIAHPPFGLGFNKLRGIARKALSASPATPIGGLSLGVEGGLSDQGNSSSSVQIEPPIGLAHRAEGSS